MVRTLRERDPEIKVIFISGFFGTRSLQNELMQEIERFGYPRLAKPFRPSQLLELVRRALG
jgi:DNA-binding NtrC family response regulator